MYIFYTQMYNEIIHFLDQKRLKEGLVQLKAFAMKTDDWELQSDIENLQMTYHYMLQYAAQGQADPEREKMFRTLLRKGYELADRTFFIQKYGKEYGKFSDKIREFKLHPAHSYTELGEKLSSIENQMQISSLLNGEDDHTSANQELRLKLLDELFNKTWTATHWSKEEFKEASALFQQTGISAFDIAIFASSITLNLLLYFDPYKFNLLVNLYKQNQDPEIQLRALVGIALGAYYHEERLILYPELIQTFSQLSEQPNFTKDLHHIQVIFLLSRETEKIDKKINEEIIPQVMKNQKLINPNTDVNEIDFDELEEQNPEWKKELNKITEQLDELSKLRFEGADTNMGTFSQLKNYPFFQEAAHWFYPFNKEIPLIAPLFKGNKLSEKSVLGTFLASSIFCNSDKYSLCITLKSIPKEQIELMSKDAGEQEESVIKQLGSVIQSKEKSRSNVLTRQYIQDVYRFFKLWPFRKEQQDIFKDQPAFWECRWLRPYIFQDTYEKDIAEYLFSKGYYSESAELYKNLSNQHLKDARFRQKLGFTLLKLKRYDEAVQAYEQANSLQPEDLWTLKQLAQCYKLVKNYPKALECFRQALSLEPENLNLMAQMGQCLTYLQAYDEALILFYKIEYLEKDSENILRAIGWCCFMLKEYDRASQYYQKVISQPHPLPEDWLNYGHVLLAQQDTKQALVYYRKAAACYPTHDQFAEVFINDKNVLLEQGVSEETVYILLDLI